MTTETLTDWQFLAIETAVKAYAAAGHFEGESAHVLISKLREASHVRLSYPERKTMATIKLFLHDGVWFARHSDPEIKTIMGTDTIPTPWCEGADVAEMFDALRDRNPAAEVTFA